MSIDDIKLFARNKKKELDNLKETIRIYSQDIGIKFGTEKCTLLIIKSRKKE